jgi:hypothetical protein
MCESYFLRISRLKGTSVLVCPVSEPSLFKTGCNRVSDMIRSWWRDFLGVLDIIAVVQASIGNHVAGERVSVIEVVDFGVLIAWEG